MIRAKQYSTKPTPDRWDESLMAVILWWSYPCLRDCILHISTFLVNLHLFRYLYPSLVKAWKCDGWITNAGPKLISISFAWCIFSCHGRSLVVGSHRHRMEEREYQFHDCCPSARSEILVKGTGTYTDKERDTALQLIWSGTLVEACGSLAPLEVVFCS